MSEITNSATIKVVVDGSQVESGLAKIDAAAAKTGKSLDTLGGGNGLSKVATDAESAARKVEIAGRSLASTIQRTTTALESGGKSTSAYYEAIANQRGINPALLAPYLSQLKMVEEAQRKAAAAAEDASAAQVRAAQAARNELIAQREAAQALAGRESFLSTLREQISLYGKSSEEVIRFRAAQAGVAESAEPLILQLKNIKAAHEAVAQAAREEAAAQQKSVQKQTGKDSFIASLQEQASAVGKTRSQLLEMQAAQLGLSVQAAPFIARLRETEVGVTNLGLSSKQTAAALRGVPAQFTDIVTSLQGGQAPLTVFLQQGGQLKDMFGGAGNAAKALGGYVLGLINPFTVGAAAVGVLAYAYSQGAAEAKEFNKQIILTNNAAGATASSAASSARAIAQITGTQGAAAEAVAALLATGRVAASDMTRFGEVAIRIQRELGIEVADTAKQFANLRNDPVKALKELNDSYHFVTASTYEQIKALHDQGRETEAGIAAQQAYASAFDDVTKRLEANVGKVEKAWRGAKDSAKSAWDSFLDIGRGDTESGKLSLLSQRIANRQGMLDDRRARTGTKDDDVTRIAEAELAAMRGEQELLQANVREQNRANEAKSAGVQLEADRIKWMDLGDQYLNKEAKMRKEILAVQNLGRVAQIDQLEVEKRVALIREKYTTKASKPKKTTDEFAHLMNKINGKDLGVDADFEKNVGTLSSAYASGRIGLESYMKSLGNYISQQKFAVDGEKERQKSIENVQKAIAERDSETANYLGNLDKEVLSNERLVQLFDKSKQAIELETIARLENDLANRQANEYDEKKVASLEREIAARKANAAALGGIDANEALKKAGEDLDKFLDPAKAQSFGDALRGAFGKAGDSLVKLTGTLQTYGAKQAEIEKQRGNAAFRYMNGKDSEEKYLKNISELNRQNTKEQLGSYGDMASAASGFFGEQSRGYKALQAASQVFHAAELAMTLAELIPKGISAVLTQGKGDPYTAFGRMAAMAAIVTGLGVAISGGGGSGGGKSAADVQKSQGAGSVLGDSSAKSESITRSIDLVEKNTYQGLTYSAGMLASLRAIEAAMSGLTNMVLRDGGIVDGKSFGITEGTIAKSLGGLWGKTKQNIVDSGLSFGGSLSELQAGRGFSQYASVDTTKSSWFGLSKSVSNSVQSKAISDALSQQFAMIFTGLEDTLKVAAKGIGIGSDSVSAALNNLVLESTSISLKGLKGDELTQAINAVISKAMDEIASTAFPGFEKFQKLGEGLSETVVRVANDFVAIDTVFASFGKAFGQIGLESVEARERLIDLSGGLEKFTSQGEYFLTNFFTDAEQAAKLRARIDPTLSQFGLSTEGEGASKAFRDVVVGLDTTSEAGARAYASLMAIAPAFNAVIKAAQGAADERRGLQEQLDALTLTSTQRLEQQRNALHESNRALFDNIQAINATAAAISSIKEAAGTLLGGVDNALSVVQTSVNAEKDAENKARTLRLKAVQDVIDVETAALQKYKTLSDALRSSLDQISVPGNARGDRAAAQAQIQTALAIARAGGGLPTTEGLRGALSTLSRDSSSLFSNLVDFQIDAARTRTALGDLADLTDGQISIEEQTLRTLNAQKDAIDRASNAEIERLSAIYSEAQKQVNFLKGIDANTKSVAEAMLGLADAIKAAQANPVLTGTPAISQAYKDYLGRAPDAAGLDFFTNQAAGGVPIADIVSQIANSAEAKAQSLFKDVLGRAGDAAGVQYWTQALASGMSLETARMLFMQSDEYKKLHPLSSGTNSVPRDRIALIHEGERVIPPADNRELMLRLRNPGGSNEALVAEIRALRAELAESSLSRGAEGLATAQNTRKIASTLERLMPNGDALQTRAIA
jgi:phage-related minor tail protein